MATGGVGKHIECGEKREWIWGSLVRANTVEASLQLPLSGPQPPAHGLTCGCP